MLLPHFTPLTTPFAQKVVQLGKIWNFENGLSQSIQGVGEPVHVWD